MAVKAMLILCASALFVQSALSQCPGRIGAGLGCRGGLAYDGLAFDGLAYDGLAYGARSGRLGCGAAIAPAADIAAASSLNAAYGGGLPISSASAIAPTGLSVASDNAYEGAVAVAGNLPFLGTVAMEGVFPTAGAGAVSYRCGDGAVGITAEGPIGAIGAIAPAAVAPGLGYGAGLGLGYRGYANRGCGCGCGAPYVY